MTTEHDWTETITLTYEVHGQKLSASWSNAPLNTNEVMEWIETQAMPAIGFNLQGDKNNGL